MFILCSQQEHTKRKGTDVAMRGFGVDSGRNSNAQGHGWLRGPTALPRGLSKGSATVSAVYYVRPLCGHTLRELFLETRKWFWVGGNSPRECGEGGPLH